jgi:hypothetical protein
MNISVKIIKENKDGSADATVRYDKEGLETLVQWGIVAMLTKAIDEYRVRPNEAEASIQPKVKKPVAKKTTTVAKKTIKRKTKK